MVEEGGTEKERRGGKEKVENERTSESIGNIYYI